MKKILSILMLSVFVLLMTQCATKASKAITAGPVPTPEQIKADYTTAQLDKGKTIWESSCNKCHKLFEPDSRTPEKWNNVLKRMIPRAKLNMEDGKLVRAYLIANAKTEK